jgi:hypothetical protein
MSEPIPPIEWTTDDRRDAVRFPIFLVACCSKDGGLTTTQTAAQDDAALMAC